MSDSLHYKKQVLANPLEVVQEFLSFGKVLMESRSQLLKSYGVPKINEPLVALDDVITQLSEKLVEVTMREGTSEWELNAQLLEFYAEYDVQHRGSIA